MARLQQGRTRGGWDPSEGHLQSSGSFGTGHAACDGTANPRAGSRPSSDSGWMHAASVTPMRRPSRVPTRVWLYLAFPTHEVVGRIEALDSGVSRWKNRPTRRRRVDRRRRWRVRSLRKGCSKGDPFERPIPVSGAPDFRGFPRRSFHYPFEPPMIMSPLSHYSGGCGRVRAMRSPSLSPGSAITAKRSTHSTLVRQPPPRTSSRDGAPCTGEAAGRSFHRRARRWLHHLVIRACRSRPRALAPTYI